jgi:hypothetical protein
MKYIFLGLEYLSERAINASCVLKFHFKNDDF